MQKPECCEKINNKCYLIASLAVFVTLFVTDFLIHGVLLKEQYKATASLWRPESEMNSYFPWMLGGQFVTALSFTRIFAHGYKNKGIKEGICFGVMMSAFMAGQNLVMYAVTPWPLSLVGAWIGLCAVQSVILGVMAAKVYKTCN